jgi:MFS transporter, DHA1 family, tetracycline resistance protein
MSSKKTKKSPISTIFLTTFIDLLGVGLVIPIVAPLFLESNQMLSPDIDYKIRAQLLGYLVATFSIFQFFSSPILGSLSDKYGRKNLLYMTVLATILSYTLMGLSISLGNIYLFFLGRGLTGFAAGNISVIYAALADISTPETKPKNFGLVGAAFGLGFIIGPVIGGLLSDSTLVSWFSYSIPFYASALLAFVNLVVIYKEFIETLVSPNPNIKVSLLTGLQNIQKALVSNVILRTIFLVAFLFVFGFTFFTQFFQVYLIKKFAYQQRDIGLFFGYIGILISVTQGGLVRVFAKKFRPAQILSITILTMSLGYLVVLIPDVSWQLYLFMPLISISQGLTFPNVSTLVSNSAPAHLQGETLGMQQSIQSLAQIFPPIIGGFAVSFAIEFPMYLAAMCCFMAWAIFIGKFGKEK